MWKLCYEIMRVFHTGRNKKACSESMLRVMSGQDGCLQILWISGGVQDVLEGDEHDCLGSGFGSGCNWVSALDAQLCSSRNLITFNRVFPISIPLDPI